MPVETPAKKDSHKSGYLIRLPESFRKPLKELKTRTRRPTTHEIQLALQAHFREMGVALPEPKQD